MEEKIEKAFQPGRFSLSQKQEKEVEIHPKSKQIT